MIDSETKSNTNENPDGKKDLSKVKCPACKVCIDGEFWPCSVCGDTGITTHEKITEWENEVHFYFEMMHQTNKDDER